MNRKMTIDALKEFCALRKMKFETFLDGCAANSAAIKDDIGYVPNSELRAYFSQHGSARNDNKLGNTLRKVEGS